MHRSFKYMHEIKCTIYLKICKSDSSKDNTRLQIFVLWKPHSSSQTCNFDRPTHSSIMIVADRLVHYWRTSIHVSFARPPLTTFLFCVCVDKFRIPLPTHLSIWHIISLCPPTIHHDILLIYHCKEIVLFYFPLTLNLLINESCP